jgi:hypothetical protein
VAAVAAAALLMSYGAGMAYAGPGGGGKGQGGSATITGDFDNNCKEFDGGSDKDISNVVIVYQDGTTEKQEFQSGHTFSKDSSKPMKSVTIKSGTKSQTFECPECQDGIDNDGDGKIDFDKNNDGVKDADADPDCDSEDDDSESGGGGTKPQCSDGVDNADPEDTLVDAADPGCHTDGNAGNSGSYDPNDNDETDPAPKPQCSDGVDNADPEDTLVDAADPGCHTDGNAGNSGSYDPNDNDETDATAPKPQCSDGVDNADPEDTLVDAADPGCHTDGNAGNSGSYDPNDNDETDQGGGGATLTCRASTLRVENSPLNDLLGDPFEPFVANDGDGVCKSEAAGVIDETVGDPALGFLHIALLQATTTAPGSAASGVLRVAIQDGTGATVISADVLTADGTASCAAFDSSSRVVGLNIMGTPIEVSDETDIPLGPLGTLHLNYQDTTADQETQRALFLEGSPLGDVIVAETVVDRHNC